MDAAGVAAAWLYLYSDIESLHPTSATPTYYEQHEFSFPPKDSQGKALGETYQWRQ
jgi:hypothetical protein